MNSQAPDQENQGIKIQLDIGGTDQDNHQDKLGKDGHNNRESNLKKRGSGDSYDDRITKI